MCSKHRWYAVYGNFITCSFCEGASTKLAAFVEVSETLTNVDRKTELGKLLAWSNDLGMTKQ